MSEYEEFLGDAWTDSFKRRLGGFRALTSISDMVAELTAGKHFDFVFYDTGPNIGPLNRVLLLDSDYFIVPVACDLFSVRALSTLGQTLKKWIMDARTIRSIAPDGTQLLAASPKFLGYLPQRFKVYGQVMAQEPAHYLRQIRRQMYKSI
jgi:cellulose biosynthesis protein BcsQ